MSIIRRFTPYLFRFNDISLNCAKRVELLSERRVRTRLAMSFQFSTLNDLKVEHNLKKHQFFVRLGSEKAVLDYRDVSPGVVDLFHTEVPKALQGKGIAKLLAQEAFDYVVTRDLKMIVNCTYLQKFLKDNQKPEYLQQLFQTKD